MILRTLNATHHMIRQPEHARHSAVLTASLRPEFLGSPPEQSAALTAVYHHDDGWIEYETAPRLGDNGMMLDFMHMPAEDHVAIWERAIFDLYRSKGPLVGAAIARHARVLQRDDEIAAYQEDLAAHLMELAYPGKTHDETAPILDRIYNALKFGDVLSLIASVGWDDEYEVVLNNPKGELEKFKAWRDGDWTVRIHPWPFVTPELRAVHIAAACVPVGKEKRALGVFQEPGEALVKVQTNYLPG